ncbi:hypothetical protein GUITHDRAFT_88432 [Guillardia theta CCMP2712]|uniref:Protein kinase domain-containing protein n=1 Tax=Guillardia theta (strain CCMP2712) TaxID=905079 RepID=L1IYM8_GUITC|nr:hypothetical protein GUITHDRAFT_88432 [Guillardia theta CCMP2712]EKX41326.1 hypothetical protein GUITHDRAFT_88432 [Guillardia theta CCMP2712]|eukprot:XP_005828306.1 hypothetical protein GUITHDRAFT_88432 [Guillardia theta CCMP2712]
MEMALGGEMFGRIAERGAFTELEAANAFRQILEAVGHMHTRGVVHCDLKPENILYEDDTDRQIKIADFGFAQFIPGGSDGGQTLTKQLGTLSYTAPEILMGIGYDTKADMWSLGVILYILLSGIPPFGKRRGETDHDVKRNICRGNWRFYDSHFRNVSEQAKDLVKCLIVLDPKKRLDYEQALSHSWFQVLVYFLRLFPPFLLFCSPHHLPLLASTPTSAPAPSPALCAPHCHPLITYHLSVSFGCLSLPVALSRFR